MEIYHINKYTIKRDKTKVDIENQAWYITFCRREDGGSILEN